MNENKPALFSTAYFPPVSYFITCLKQEKITIDKEEFFIKQTYRNRCHIAGPNGLQKLIVPLQHNNLSHTPVKDVKISYDTPWPVIHWRSIRTAYANAPYFEFFCEEVEALFKEKHVYLADLNETILAFLYKTFRKNIITEYTERYELNPEDKSDYRNYFNPKITPTTGKKYHQVFEDKNGFLPDLSALDLVFNNGTQL